MIIYSNKNRIFTGEAYDETYRHDPDRFGHTITFRALDELFAGRMNVDQPIRAFDLGCGQGQVISYVWQFIERNAPQHLSASALFGIDISDVAIKQCEQREPTINWIADSFQDFLDREDSRRYIGTFDLVINKGGLTQVRSADEYRTMLSGIARLLRVGGIYLFVQYKQFYQVWSNDNCADWDTDIFDVGESVFGPAALIQDDSAYICVYRKAADTEHAPSIQPPMPRRIVFHMNDNSEQSVFVSGDALTAQRLQRTRAVADRKQFVAFDPQPGAKEKDIQRHADRTRDAGVHFVPGQPRVLLGLGRVRMMNARAADVYQPIADALHERCNVLVWPGMIATVRHLCKCVSQWSAHRPDVVVIGPGLEDFKIDCAVNLPNVDRDEFRYRLRWVLEVLRTEAGSRVVYVATPAAAQFSDVRNGYDYDVAIADQYVGIAQQLCADYEATFVDARVHISQTDRNAVGSELASVIRDVVAQSGSPACAR